MVLSRTRHSCCVWRKSLLTSFLLAAGDSWCFLPDSSSDMTVPCLYLNTVVCPVDLGTCCCFEMAPCDIPDLFKSIMGSFRSMLSSLDFPIVVFVAESNGCIKQALLKWAPRSPHLLSIRITQNNLRGHATKNTRFTQLSIITKIDLSSYCL